MSKNKKRPKGFVCVKTENGQWRSERIEYVQGVVWSGSSVEIFIQTSPEKPIVMVDLAMSFDEVMAEIARAQK